MTIANPALGQIVVDPTDVTRFDCDWSQILPAARSLTTSSWDGDTGLTLTSGSTVGFVTSIMISGGTAGTDYDLRNTVVADTGETRQRSLRVRVKQL